MPRVHGGVRVRVHPCLCLLSKPSICGFASRAVAVLIVAVGVARIEIARLSTETHYPQNASCSLQLFISFSGCSWGTLLDVCVRRPRLCVRGRVRVRVRVRAVFASVPRRLHSTLLCLPCVLCLLPCALYRVPCSMCCGGSYIQADPDRYLSTDHDGEILFTYDVTWDITPMPWTQRWVHYVICFGAAGAGAVVLLLLLLLLLVLVPSVLNLACIIP